MTYISALKFFEIYHWHNQNLKKKLLTKFINWKKNLTFQRDLCTDDLEPQKVQNTRKKFMRYLRKNFREGVEGEISYKKADTRNIPD